MGRKRTVLLFFILIVLMMLGYWGLQARKAEAPSGGAQGKGQLAPQEKVEQPAVAAETIKAPQLTQQTVRLPQEAKQGTAVKTNGFQESIKKEEEKSIRITPGIAYQSGQGLKLQVPDSEEQIQIRRDNTDKYRMQWEKKF